MQLLFQTVTSVFIRNLFGPKKCWGPTGVRYNQISLYTEQPLLFETDDQANPICNRAQLKELIQSD
jgi:hypothetical protein